MFVHRKSRAKLEYSRRPATSNCTEAPADTLRQANIVPGSAVLDTASRRPSPSKSHRAPVQ